MTDTNENSVDYTWTCLDDDPGTPGMQVQDCYPDDRDLRALRREPLSRNARPDKLSFAIGDATTPGEDELPAAEHPGLLCRAARCAPTA